MTNPATLSDALLNEIRDYFKSRGDFYVGEVTYLNECYVHFLKYTNIIGCGAYIGVNRRLEIIVRPATGVIPFADDFDIADPKCFITIAEYVVERAKQVESITLRGGQP